MGEAAVIGRDEELGAVRGFLERVADGPGALVLSGEAGIGKTILWEVGVEEARERFSRVLTCRGVEAEASFAFAGLSELLAGVVGEVAPGLVPPRRRALEVALQLAEPGDTAPDAHVIGLALLDALQALADRGGPVLVAVDDAQWLDPASASVMQIAFRRLREERLGLLATVRLGPEVEGALELDRFVPEGRLERLSLGPLTLGALHRLLEQRLGLELTRSELARVQEATAGNPFFALELGRELVRTNTRPTPGQALRVPDSLRELLGGRLDRLPTHTGDVLLQAAALARPTVELVTAAYGDRERVLEALEAAVHEGIVQLDDSHVRFAHPLLASLSYVQAPVWKRRAVHRTLADVVTDSEERARHLGLAADGPDAAVASELDTAAAQAAARGAPHAAAELCELAAELTPDDPTLARMRRFRAASLGRLAGDIEHAVARLRELLEEVPPGVERADVWLELLMTERGPRTQIELCDEALADAAGDEVRSARVLRWRAGAHLMAGDARAALADAHAALELAERADDPILLAVVIAWVALIETYRGETTPGLLERGLELEKLLGLQLEWNDSPRYMLARRLTRLGEIERARGIWEELESDALERGDEGSRLILLWQLSMLEWLAGRWGQALEQATAAYELTEQTQHGHAWTWVGRAKALIEADLGLVEQARLSAEEGLAHSESTSREYYTLVTLGVLGRLELALGNLQAAGEHLRELPGRLLAGGINDPTEPVWADAVETLVALGEVERARAYLQQHEANAQRLGSPWALATAARCRGLLSAAEGDPTAASAAFERSLADAACFPLERGRTLLSLGTVRRQAQQKKAAREALEQALEIFEGLGARLWAEKTRAELRRISGRAPASGELTETERRVAELATHGRTNKEIAAQLFMGVSTVEAHLSHVYRKLGIRSRTELAARVATPVDEAAQL